MRGKNKCKILKQIRQKIADENDIPYVTRECNYQGECRGTCPKCEAELRYLEQQLALRKSLGKKVAVAAVAAGLSLSMSGCDWPFTSAQQLTGDVAYVESSESGITLPTFAKPQSETETKTEATETAGTPEPKDAWAELTGRIAPKDPVVETIPVPVPDSHEAAYVLGELETVEPTETAGEPLPPEALLGDVDLPVMTEHAGD